ncbi:MAG: hypothetical protein AB9856_01760 [Cellulosilyticaceae bacterium]
MNETELKLYHSRNRLFFLWIFTANLIGFLGVFILSIVSYGLRFPVPLNILWFMLLVSLIFTPTFAALCLLKTKLYPKKKIVTAIIVGLLALFSSVLLFISSFFPLLKSFTTNPSHYMILDQDVKRYVPYLSELFPSSIPSSAQNVHYQSSCYSSLVGCDAKITAKWTLPEKEFWELEKQITTNPNYKQIENKWQLESPSSYYNNVLTRFVNLDKNNFQVEYTAKISD